MSNVFLDTNVLLYLMSADESKADRAEQLMLGGGLGSRVVSVQILNEFANVAMRKLDMSLPEIREVLQTVRIMCSVEAVTVETHDSGLDLSERYGFAIYDSMMLASALLADCSVVYTEDLQNGQNIEGTLAVNNPFAES
ncbi:MAG: PIN domain-containing protein [Pseudomonadales bacterium]